MEAKLKKIMELETLVSQSISPTLLRPDLRKFRDISAIISGTAGIAKDFAKIIKGKLKNAQNPKTLMLLLELVEYTTCTCDGALHAEYNDKGFLQIFNAIFNNKNLREEIQLKALSLVQLWFVFFQADAATYPNFAWYYNAIKDRGVVFPEFQKSSYLSMNVSQIEAHSFNENPHITQRSHERPKARESVQVEEQEQPNNAGAQMKGSARRLYKDLCDVYGNIQLSNEMIDQKNIEVADDIIVAIKPIEKRLLALPDKLLEANEDFLYKFCLALVEDTGVTIDRHTRLSNKQPVPKFHFKAKHVLKEHNLLGTDGSPVNIEKPIHSTKSQNQTRELNMTSVDPFSKVDNKFYLKESISTIQATADYDDETMKDSMFNDFGFQQFDEEEQNQIPTQKPAPNNTYAPQVMVSQQNAQMNFNKNNKGNFPANTNVPINRTMDMPSNNFQPFPPTQNNPKSFNTPNVQPDQSLNYKPMSKTALIEPPQPRTSQQSNSSNMFRDSFGSDQNRHPFSNGSNSQMKYGANSQELKQTMDDIDLLSFDVPIQAKRQSAQPDAKKTPSLNDDLLVTFDSELIIKNQPQSKTLENIDIDFTRLHQSTPQTHQAYPFGHSNQSGAMPPHSEYQIRQSIGGYQHQSQHPQNLGQPYFNHSTVQQTHQGPINPRQSNPFGMNPPPPQTSDPYQHLNLQSYSQDFKPLDCFDYSLPQKVHQTMRNDGGTTHDPFASLPDPNQVVFPKQQAK
jgi:hypothetical protein